MLPGRHGHGTDPLAMLRRLYPAAHPLLGDAHDSTVGEADAEGLATAPHLLPALDPAANPAGAFGLAWLVHRLRQPDGCPWDREQDHQTLKPFLLEETYEVYDALDGGSTPELAEELGDLLLQIVLHAQYAAEAGIFDLSDVQRGITTKIISRHPHVFADVVADTPDEVMRNWEQLKADERAAERQRRHRRVTPTCPRPSRACRSRCPRSPMPTRCRAVPPPSATTGPTSRASSTRSPRRPASCSLPPPTHDRHEEYGDLLFVLVNMGRKLGVDPEAALRSASRKFASRFARVERLADDQGLQLKALGLDALDDLWQLAKREETIEKEGL